MRLSSQNLIGRKLMVTKLMLVLFFLLPVSAANTDDEIIKNLDFFQSMEMLKNDVAFAATGPDKEKTKTQKQTIKRKEETKSSAPEKN